MTHQMTFEELVARDTRPLSHRLDPHSSGEAAEHMVMTGKAIANRTRVLNALRSYPARTAGELGYLAGLGPVEVRRRLSDLKRMGYAVQGEVRTCQVEGTRQCAWYPASTPPPADVYGAGQ